MLLRALVAVLWQTFCRVFLAEARAIIGRLSVHRICCPVVHLCLPCHQRWHTCCCASDLCLCLCFFGWHFVVAAAVSPVSRSHVKLTITILCLVCLRLFLLCLCAVFRTIPFLCVCCAVFVAVSSSAASAICFSLNPFFALFVCLLCDAVHHQHRLLFLHFTSISCRVVMLSSL